MVPQNQHSTKSWVADVAAMHQKFGVHDAMEKLSPEHKAMFLRFRLDFLLEELKEAYEASGFQLMFNISQVDVRENLTEKNAENVVDALIDLSVVAITTLDLMKVDADKAWSAVHDANMAKQVGVKEGRPNPLGLPDLVKPAGWVAPSHAGNTGSIGEVFGK